MQSPSSHTIKSAGNQTHVAMTHADHTLQRLIQLSSKFHVTTYRCHEGRGSKGEGSCTQEETGDGPDFVHRLRLDMKIIFLLWKRRQQGGRARAPISVFSHACQGAHDLHQQQGMYTSKPYLRSSWAALITRNMMAPAFCVSDKLNNIN